MKHHRDRHRVNIWLSEQVLCERVAERCKQIFDKIKPHFLNLDSSFFISEQDNFLHNRAT